MPITVETGSGLANADALVSVAAADAYHAARGNATWTGTDAVKEIAIRRATAVLEGYAWQGKRVRGQSQALQWPRYDVIDREGLTVSSTIVPTGIVNACAELALRELVSPGSLTPDYTAAETVSREKVGSLEVEYANASTGASSIIPVMPVLGPLISQYLAKGGGSNALAGMSYRV